METEISGRLLITGDLHGDTAALPDSFEREMHYLLLEILGLYSGITEMSMYFWMM